MSNEYKDFTIKLHCNEAFYRALVLMLRYASGLCRTGASRVVAIYCDGDGYDKVEVLETSEPVAESDKGVLSHERLTDLGPRWFEGDFLLDTDQVYHSIEG